MSYEVRCECGKRYPLGAADAGVSFPCPCGRDVDVPPLHMLRASAGQHPVSPVVQLQSLFLRRELPGTRQCACCGRETDHLIHVSVVCERVVTNAPATGRMLLSGCLMVFTGVFIFSWGGADEQHGSEVAFNLPVRACEVCARELTTLPAIRKALTATAAYAALLQQYPNALVRRIG